MFISTYREQTHRINKVGYGSEIWLRGVVLLISEPSACTSLTVDISVVAFPFGLCHYCSACMELTHARVFWGG